MNRLERISVRFFPILVLAAVACVSCSRQNRNVVPTPTVRERPASPDTGASTAEQTASTSKPISLQRERSASNDSPDRETEIVRLTVTRNDSLVSNAPLVPVYPFDFEIGRLVNETMSGDTEALVRVSDRFFGEIGAGAFSRETVHPKWIEHVAMSLRPHLGSNIKFVAVRYGIPRFTDEQTAHMVVRAFGTSGQAIGSIVLSLERNRWYVSDFLTNLNKLHERVPSRTTPFDPTITRQRG